MDFSIHAVPSLSACERCSGPLTWFCKVEAETCCARGYQVVYESHSQMNKRARFGAGISLEDSTQLVCRPRAGKHESRTNVHR